MKFQELIGLAVFDVEEGKEIGKISDVLISVDWKIQALELEGKGFFNSSAKSVSWEDIMAYGEDAVMIRNQQAVRKTGADDIQYTYILGKNKLKDLNVLTEDGVLLGKVTDVYFDQEMGNTILGLEISDGFVSDLMEGRKWLPLTQDMSIGKNAIMVPPMSEERLEKTIHSVNG
ncbi:photosystem reaction center subunit H [Paenibacillus sp. HJL G12]|uniref:Photosystem reaction center subunit H n=1 Tax=Paenibacillus dendrobii TaxID=2691084 RepID=A0A7X3IK75_9BACL|nr:PRC-barrel domain-containing protein [Paenibacillus dendrobii]MWV45459.1 photosystem reaction center subunit H [Paenibacillus dendrobii]